MKRLTYLLFLAIGVTGCSVDSIDSTENLLTADSRFRTQSTVTIAAPEGELCAGEVYLFSVNVNTSSNFQVQQKVDGQWVQVNLAPQGQSGSVSFEVILAEGDNFFRHTNQGSGPNWVEYSTSFTGVDCNSCENLLVADLVCGDVNTLTLTFTAEEAGPIVIQGGLTNGTTINSASSNVLEKNTSHPGQGNSNANVTRWEGDIEACEVVKITIEFIGGEGVGDWTAKRGVDDNEVTLGETEDIKCN
jgi:hypothetical protein